MNRRHWLKCAVSAGLGATFGRAADAPLRFPEKVPLKILGDRPPNLETPWKYFRTDLTPNDAFFVRWHLQFIPTTIDLRTWRLKVAGHVERPLQLSLTDLRRMAATSVVAVNQCSGNSRGLFEPHMPGAQWGNGAMGNARWTGVPLRALLDKAGVKAGAVEVSFDGLDESGYSTVPDYIKSLSVDKAREPEVLVAYEMNGAPLPMLNGFPVRLIVPGWYATYWVKSLTTITVLPQKYDGFWMAKAYRIPPTAGAVESPTDLAKETLPISRMNVRSFFTPPDEGFQAAANTACPLDGIAFDGGDGIKSVDVSVDGGTTWRPAELGPDLGKFSFRRWRLAWRPERSGSHRLLVRATNGAGQVQPMSAGWNRSGYMRNVVEELSVEVR
jgi:DMSO/TMAO reductase YedYZ molybdopterin-dependent catalytic subunit